MATIPHVVPDTLIESAAQNAFIDEVNNVCAKRTGSNMSGTLTFTNAAPAFRLRRTGEQPYFQFESVAGTRLGFIMESAGNGMYFAHDAPGEFFRWQVNGVNIATLDAANGLVMHIAGMDLTVPGAVDIGGNIAANSAILTRNDDANQIALIDSAGSGGTVEDGHAYMSFYPSGTASAAGARGGYIGFHGEGLQLQADAGNAYVQSVNAAVKLEAATVVIMDPVDGCYIGKSVSDTAEVGTEIFTNNVGVATAKGTIRNTVANAGAPNLTLRHTAAASADGQKFISFVNNAGAEVGSITQQGSGIRINNDLLLAQVEALEARITELEARLS